MPNAAQTYFNSFSKAAQDQIKSSWGGEDLMNEWFSNAKAAGAVGPQGGGGGDSTGAAAPSGGSGNKTPYQESGPTDALGNPNQGYQAEEGGNIAAYGDAAGEAEWKGKRKPTVGELRKWARSQHSSYLGGDRSSQDEDYERYNDDVLKDWIEKSWDVKGGNFRNEHGSLVAKPGDTAQGDPGYGQGGGGGGGGGGRGGRGGAPQPPPKPTTMGKQLSYTGDPMTDMLLYQFNNTSRAAEAGGGQNIMGLGEDGQAGGEGANEDTGGVGQLLKGGGLWRAMSGDAFGGFRADEKNTTDPAANPAAKKKKKRGGRGGAAPAPAEIAAPPAGIVPDGTPGSSPSLPTYKSDVLYGGNKDGMRKMMENNYQNSNFGGQQY